MLEEIGQSELIAIRYTDHSPGRPYRPSIRGTALYRHPTRKFGKRFFIAADINPASITWVTDEWAEEFIEKAKVEERV